MTERRPSPTARSTRRASARSASRPGQRGDRPRPVAATRPDAVRADSTVAPRPKLTGRAAILVLVLAMLVVSYASSMRAYLQLRAQIDTFKSQIATTSASIDDLEREKRRRQDPAFLEAQARERFDFVMPGETSYRVLDENGLPLDAQEALSDPTTIVANQAPAWWGAVWETVELAGNPPAAKPPPASELKLSDSSGDSDQ